MASIQELRNKYPQYKDMADSEFADAFHRKFYSDIPKEEFNSKIGFSENNIEKKNENKNKNMIEHLPALAQFMLKAFPSTQKPIAQGIDERAQGLGRGFVDIGEGLKQTALENFGKPGEAKKYTQERESERKFYENSSAGRDPLANLLRENAKELPVMAALGPVLSRSPLLMKMFSGGMSTGLAKGTQFVPQGKSRLENIGEGVALGAGLPLALEAPNLIATLGGKAINAGKGILNIGKEALGSNIPELEKGAEQATARHESNVEAENLAKQEAGTETPHASPSKMKRAIAKNEEKLAEYPLRESNLPIPSTQESAEQLDRAREYHENQTRNLHQVENDISHHLNIGAVHDVDSAAQIHSIQEKRRKDISNVYDDVTSNLKQKNIHFDNSQAIQDATTKLNTMIRAREANTPQAERLLTEIERLREMPKKIPADEYLTMIRSAKDYAREARRKAFLPDVNAEERAAWHQRFNELDDTIEKMEDVFENHIDPKDAEHLRIANKAWRTEVKPLQRNTTYQTIRHRGRIEGNIMQKLRGTDPGDVLMRGMIKKNPELLRNVVGQQFANQPAALHDIGALEKEYVDQMPELQNMMTSHAKESLGSLQSERTLKNAQEKHNKLIDQESKAFKKAEKEKENISENKKERIKLKNEIELYNKNIHKLEKLAKSKNLSLKEKVKTEKELNKAKEKRNSARIKAYALLGLVGGASITAGIHKVEKLLGVQ